MKQTQRTLQEYRSTLPPAEIIARARVFFTRRNSLYATFLETVSENHAVFRGQGGEELIIAATVTDGSTLVTGSTYLFDMQIARFFTTLPAFEATEMLLPPVADAVPAVTA